VNGRDQVIDQIFGYPFFDVRGLCINDWRKEDPQNEERLQGDKKKVILLKVMSWRMQRIIQKRSIGRNRKKIARGLEKAYT